MIQKPGAVSVKDAAVVVLGVLVFAALYWLFKPDRRHR